MCGIVCAFNIKDNKDYNLDKPFFTFKMSKINIIILSASLMALGAFSIDTILPSISYLKKDFN